MGDWAGVLRGDCVRLSDLESDALCLQCTSLLARLEEEEEQLSPAVKCEGRGFNGILTGTG